VSAGTSGVTISESRSPAKRRRSPIFWWVIVGVAFIVLAALRGLLQVNPAPQYGIAVNSTGSSLAPAADFTLDSTLGRPVSLSEFQGHPVLLYFGYTTCPDVCPTTLGDLRTTMQALGSDANKVQVLFVSVDPERDTVDRLQTYLGAFDPAFVGLTGPLGQIEAIASRFGVFFQKSSVESAAGYLVDHTSAVLLLDADGALRLMFPYGTTGEQIASDTRLYIR